MNFAYFIAAVVLFVVGYLAGKIANFVRFPMALIVLNLSAIILKLVAVILVIVGIVKAAKGEKFTNVEEKDLKK